MSKLICIKKDGNKSKLIPIENQLRAHLTPQLSDGLITHTLCQTSKKEVFRWHKLAFRFLQESFFRTQTSDRLWKRLNTFKVLDYCWLFSVGPISVPEKFPHYSCIQYLIIEREKKKPSSSLSESSNFFDSYTQSFKTQLHRSSPL